MSEFKELVPKTWTMKKILGRYDTQTIVIRRGHIAVTNYHIGDNPGFEKSLSVWNEMYWRYEVVGFYYVKELKEIRVNRSYNLWLLARFFPRIPVKVDPDVYDADQIDVKLLTSPRDDVQKLCIAFIAAQAQYEDTINATQKFIQLPPGSGKTYSICSATCFYKARTVVIMPLSVLVEQWIDSYTTFTNIKKEEILYVKGSKKCEEIRQGLHQDKKVFLFLVDTITSYHERYGSLKTMEMFENTHAFLLGVDECHLDLRALSIILAMQNFGLTIFLTASPDRTNPKESKIYKNLFHDLPVFGGDVLHKDEKYLNVIVKEYRYRPSPEAMQRMNTKMGLNGKAYETELIHATEYERKDFEDAFIVMLKWINERILKRHRVLVLCSTIEGTEYLANLCKKVFDKDEVASYYGTMKKEAKKTALTKRIICATSSSCGTGFDMPGMVCCFNIMTYSSNVSAIQLSGRVRKPKDGSPAIYCEFVNCAYYKCMNQYKARKAKLASQNPKNHIMVIN